MAGPGMRALVLAAVHDDLAVEDGDLKRAVVGDGGGGDVEDERLFEVGGDGDGRAAGDAHGDAEHVPRVVAAGLDAVAEGEEARGLAGAGEALEAEDAVVAGLDGAGGGGDFLVDLLGEAGAELFEDPRGVEDLGGHRRLGGDAALDLVLAVLGVMVSRMGRAMRRAARTCSSRTRRSSVRPVPDLETYGADSPRAGVLRRYSVKRKTPLAATARRTAATPLTPSHLPSRYCQGATGLVIVCQMTRSRCSKATVPTLRKRTSRAMIQNEPPAYWRKDCTR